jgi:hypothetical protein
VGAARAELMQPPKSKLDYANPDCVNQFRSKKRWASMGLLAALDTACTNVDELGQASAELFRTHPDYEVITSFPGLADSTGAQVRRDRR